MTPQILDLPAFEVFLFDRLDEGREVIQVTHDLRAYTVTLTLAARKLVPDEVCPGQLRPEYANVEEITYRKEDGDIVRVARPCCEHCGQSGLHGSHELCMLSPVAGEPGQEGRATRDSRVTRVENSRTGQRPSEGTGPGQTV